MAYGFKVVRGDGTERLGMSSWAAKFYAHYRFEVRNGTTHTIYISGFDPNTWGVVINMLSGLNDSMAILRYQGKIVLDPGSYYTDRYGTFDFIVYKG